MPKLVSPEIGRRRRVCIFCGSDRKRSKEHIFGLWLKEFFPRNADTTHTASYISFPDKHGPTAPTEARENKQGHTGSKQLKIVCSSCNNGWMGTMEERVKPILIPLIIGERRNLSMYDQSVLATWASKTAMVAEYSKPIEDGITQGERTWLMEKQTPPPKWFVWIGAYHGTDWRDLAIFQNRGSLSPAPVASPSKAPYYMQATTFGAGHVIFCVLSTSSPHILPNFLGLEANGLFQICPSYPRSILWPPAHTLGDTEANGLANIFRTSGVFDHSLDPGADWTFTL